MTYGIALLATSKHRRTAPAVHDMGTKMQYNPSTGLASYNAVTGKVQALNTSGVPCIACTDAPARIRFTFSGLTSTCCELGTLESGYWDSDVEDFVNSEFVIDQLSSGCNWIKTFTLDEGKWVRRLGSDCTGSLVIDYSTSLVLRYNVGADGEATLTMAIYAIGFSIYPIIAQIWSNADTGKLVDKNCIPISDMIPQLSVGDCVSGEVQPMVSGTVSIEAI